MNQVWIELDFILTEIEVKNNLTNVPQVIKVFFI